MLNEPRRSIMVASVFHTGTRFFLGLIGDAIGEKYFHILHRHPHVEWHPLVLCHVEAKRMKHIYYYMEHYNPVLVMTERDHDKVINSWDKRKTKYHTSLGECMALRESLIKEFDPIIVSVDAPDRDERLQKLADAIGVELKTDWQPKQEHVV